MTALASTDVTVTVNARDRDIGHGALGKNMGVASIVFGDGALTYPTGGVPLPGIGSLGLLRQVDIGIVEPPPGDGYVYKYDRANHKLLIYTAAGFTPAGTIPVTDGTAGNAVTFNTDHLEATGGGDLTLTGSAVAAAALAELANTAAPAATTLKMFFLGE